MTVISLADYNIMTFCRVFKDLQETSYEEQEVCTHAVKSKTTGYCLWMRADGTCASAEACNEALEEKRKDKIS